MGRKLGWILFALSACLSVQASATEYIVKLKNHVPFTKSVSALSAVKGIKIADLHATGNLLKVTFDAKSKNSEALKIASLLQRSDVEYIVENIKVHSFERSNDVRTAEQWALDRINAFSAWDTTKGSKDVLVAVIDTGADVKHEDLAANLWVNKKEIPDNKIDDDKNGFIDDINGWDFFQNDNTPNDETSPSGNPGHGTHCSGIVGAVGNNHIGISGINQAVSIMPIRFLGADGSGDLFASVKAIDFAILNGAQVISASWGAEVSRSSAKPIIDAIDRANQKNILFVAAAGNDGVSNDSRPSFPANAGLDNVINVAASDKGDKKPYWSNFGRWTVDLASPGDAILSTIPLNKYKELSGTSMATPLVAGLAALLKSINPDLTPKQLRAILQSTGAKVSIETACNCRVDASAAVAATKSAALTVVPAAAALAVGDKLQFSAVGGAGPYTFKSSSSDVGTVSSDGSFVAVKDGETTIQVQDSKGQTAQSLSILVGKKAAEGGGGSGDCPYQDPELCQIICQIAPNQPWCNN